VKDVAINGILAIFCDRRSPGLEPLALRLEDALQLGQILSRDASGRNAGDDRLEHAPDVHQLVLQFEAVAQDGRQRRDQPVHVEFLRKRALTVACHDETDRL